jgi:serine/threonine protein kinase
MNPGGGISPLTHDDANPIAPPSAFGPYRVMHQIGVGVLGPVFRTFELDGDRLVALKAFHLDLTPEHARTLADLLQGTKQAGGSHPALVPSIDAGVSDDIPYLATEYVAAESLDVAIRHYAPAPVDTAFPLIVQLADGLDAAHACGLTHGALHLRDVFLTPELARIAGFGVVPALEQVGVRGPLRRPYTAPEQMSSGESGPAADRFALAAIVYELLTGRRASGHGAHMTEQLAWLLAHGADPNSRYEIAECMPALFQAARRAD